MTVRVRIAMKTVDRSPRRNFLAETLENLERGGVFASEHLESFYLVDSGSPDLHAFLRSSGLDRIPLHLVAVSTGRRTLHQNAAKAIEIAGDSKDAKWALVLEDDIDVCANFLESVVAWLEENSLHGPMMYVFGANYEQIKVRAQRGEVFWKYPVNSFYGALACAWKTNVARELAGWLGSDPFYLNAEEEEIRHHGHDLLLGRWGKSQGLRYFLASAPNFIQHIGVESSLNNRMITYPAWYGREWSYV